MARHGGKFHTCSRSNSALSMENIAPEVPSACCCPSPAAEVDIVGASPAPWELEYVEYTDQLTSVTCLSRAPQLNSTRLNHTHQLLEQRGIVIRSRKSQESSENMARILCVLGVLALIFVESHGKSFTERERERDSEYKQTDAFHHDVVGVDQLELRIALLSDQGLL